MKDMITKNNHDGEVEDVSSSQSYELQTEAEIKSRTQLLSCNCILEEEVKNKS